MIEPMTDMPAGVVGLRARGEATKEDDERVIISVLGQARSLGPRAHCLAYFPLDFERPMPQAAWAYTWSFCANIAGRSRQWR